MLISELPEPYKSLAELRRNKNGKAANNVMGAFIYSETPEGVDFWRLVQSAKTAKELPPIKNKRNWPIALRLFLAGLFGSGAIVVAAKGDEIAPTAIMFWILAILSLAAGMAFFEQYEKDRQ